MIFHRPLLLLLAFVLAAAAPMPVRFAVLAAARPIARGAILTGDDVALTPAPGMVPGALADPAQAVGRVARRALAAGVVLRADALAEPLVVRRGEAVRLRIERPGFSVEAVGAAATDGAQGEWIAAVNSATGTRLRGAVSESGILSMEGLKAADAGRLPR